MKQKIDRSRYRIVSCQQLDIFSDAAALGGVNECSLEHRMPQKATWRIYFSTGCCRDVCGRCRRKILNDPKIYGKIDYIGPFRKLKNGSKNQHKK